MNEQPVFEVASQLASKKEQAIIKALDHVFGVDQWEESSVVGKASLDELPNGGEIFYINDQPMLIFGKLETDVRISYKSTILVFRQSIKELF